MGTRRSLRPLDVEDEVYMEQLLRRLQRYYSWRGINVRQLCHEFDVHNMGLIHHSQFYRALPKPELSVDEEDVALLVQKYRDPERPGLVNYINLSNDLDAIGNVMDAEKQTQFDIIRDMGDYLPHQMRPDQPLQDIMDRIRVCCRL